MTSRLQRDLKQILHPYLFVLKEGKAMANDLLDYSLMMLHVNCREVIRTPKRPARDLSVIPEVTGDFAMSLTEPEVETKIKQMIPRPKA